MSAEREPGQAGFRHMLLCLPSTLQQCWTLGAFLSTPLQESSKLRWAMPLVLGTAGQGKSRAHGAGQTARQGRLHGVLEMPTSGSFLTRPRQPAGKGRRSRVLVNH